MVNLLKVICSFFQLYSKLYSNFETTFKVTSTRKATVDTAKPTVSDMYAPDVSEKRVAL